LSSTYDSAKSPGDRRQVNIIKKSYFPRNEWVFKGKNMLDDDPTQTNSEITVSDNKTRSD